MVTKFCKCMCSLALVLILMACSTHPKPSAELGEMSRDDFMKSMRWKQYKTAATLIHPEVRKDFIKTFAALKDLHVTEITLLDMQVFEDNRRFETTIEMEYYLPPSASIKTFMFDQTWEFFGGDDQILQGYFVVTPFPDFP